MASSYISNAQQINFDSVLEITDNAEMVSMFKTLESTSLRGFLGCPSVLYERELEQLFDTAMVKDGDITCEVSGKVVVISEDSFKKLANLKIEEIYAKEELVLSWAEADSTRNSLPASEITQALTDSYAAATRSLHKTDFSSKTQNYENFQNFSK
ncbi:hypothetical protein F511_16945 [Dorcoceras hygrometricum]|uniref:Uncharacterized protein n=1 Tax=Dorcoceras hygrometricum TaxID=472368 RepID=A0A2Z7D130_9LAMI|nr:hypothetical protein F511_16945 [Dorcoceras hygrometricum]